jgi:adhesin isopeptide-forming family sspB-C2 type protein
MAQAAGGVGGGGVGGGGGGSGDGGPTRYALYTGDYLDASMNPVQGWGQASIDYFASAMEQDARWADSVGGDRTGINTACTQAINDAIARSNGTATMARVIQVGAAYNYSGGVPYFGWGGNQGEMASWYDGETAAGSWQPYLPFYSAQTLGAVHDAFIGSIPSIPRIVCLALNQTEMPNYDLTLSTDKAATFPTAGTTTPVSDRINASASNGIRENINATVSLRWAGVEGNAKGVAKNVTIANQGTTGSPAFTPSDFGWASWPSGKFWFDVSVAKQGKMTAAVSHGGQNDARENWTAATTPPRKILTSGAGDQLGDTEVLASGMSYNAEITARTNGYSSSMTINDTVGTSQVYIGSATADDTSAAYINDPSGNRVAGATIRIDRSVTGQVTVSGTVTGIPDTFQAEEYTLVVPTYVLPTKKDYTISDNSNVCYTAAQTGCLAGNSKVTRKVTATPDKVWVLDPNGGLTTADPGQTNQVGSDNRVFLPGDAVSAVVNGRIPANLAENLSTYKLIDDWSKAAEYVDFSDASQVAVYAETSPGSGSYVSVTGQFDIKINGSVTTATAKASFLSATKGLAVDRKTKLIISGNFRTDFATKGQTVALTNAGSEVWNNETIATNEPPVYTWTPNPNKQVLGSADESGDKAHSDINGTSVWPGQKLEYSVGIDLRVPAGTARGVKSLAVEDQYDPYLIPDKSSIEFWDARDVSNPKPIARSDYKLVVDSADHRFTATFTDDWIAKNVSTTGANSQWLTQGWLTMRFTGTVSPDILQGSTVVNQAFQIINGARTGSDVPSVKIPVQNPDKESLSSNQDNIDGKTVVKGDVVVYRLTLDANPAREQLAYNVHKLGMVDDYDDEYLSLDASAIKVTEKTTGLDVTDKFNVQVKDGIAYVYAKTIDTPDVYGGPDIKGDPQPADLAAFDKAPIRPLEDPIIDQSLLGKQYWITLPTVVTKEKNGHTIENQAVQNIQNTRMGTKIVSNPLAEIDPTKDVTISDADGEKSVDAAEIRMWKSFNYRLNSSEIPANRAYAATQWSLTDAFDKAHDQYSGIWAVYANTDVYDGAELAFKKGDLIENSTGSGPDAGKGLFAVSFDEVTNTLTATPTQAYLDLIAKRADLSNGFAVYAKMVRVAPAERIENTVQESYNTVPRSSNTVWTVTPEFPELAIQKYTLSEGTTDGVHRDVKSAYAVTKDQLADGALPKDAPEGTKPVQQGVEVGIRFSNVGDVPLKDIDLVDFTQDGFHGQLEDLLCAVPAPSASASGIGVIKDGTTVKPDENGMIWVQPSTITELAMAQQVDCRGTLRGMAPGMTHGDTVAVTGSSVFTDTAVKAQDVWFAKAASTPGIEVVKYTLSEGRTAGDRNDPAAPYVITANQAEHGVQVAFDVTNTGDEALTGLKFADATKDGTMGTVTDVKWLDPVVKAPVITLGAGTTYAKAADGTVMIGATKYTEHPVSELKDLAPGQRVLLVATLTGLKPGTSHSDTATVSATALYSGAPVKDTDPWNATLPAVVLGGAVTGSPVSRGDGKGDLLGGAGLLLTAASLVGLILRRRIRRLNAS